jgi:hypothetical protein
MIKDIYLTLEVKTSFDNSTPATASSTESTALSEEEKRRNLHTKNYKAKLERRRSARLTHHDHAVRLLDMQSLQMVKDT